MARKPRDYDTELAALMERAKKLKGQKTTQLGELVQVTGADALPIEALAGVLLAAVEQSKKQPEAVARWTERGAAFFRDGAKRGGKGKAGAGEPAGGVGAAGPGTPAAGGGA
ncbi:conjugal transfer protein TraD [Roseicella aerolata]|uniref:Conjugal transfer protein TraD n=1 Tax=Roseicella aerolata TaxID=2883479 RepID=A0A9X1LCY3_9PROT|nr:conjugal transfer protein TraD [Roseicella aerolata]MCB4824543.1 conjugal transfer protein TraD [Roseicella aerolata]